MRTSTKTEYLKTILAILATGGMISMAILAPNALQALQLFGYGKKRSRQDIYRKHRYIAETITQAIRDGYVKKEYVENKPAFLLTEKGVRQLDLYRMRDKAQERPEKWDGKWRIVMFDVFEKRRKARDLLRRELASFGFRRLQNSVWIYPYPCEEFITLLKTDMRFGRNVLYIVTEKIETNKILQKHFKLG